MTSYHSILPLLILLFVSCFILTVCEFQLLLIHNNDMHSRFEETNTYSGPCSAESQEQKWCFGGFARTRTAVNEARLQANTSHIPSIFLNAGDSFQGSPYYMLKKWRIVAPLVDSLGIDVMSLGNHEFDEGISNLADYLRNVKTPVVSCNLNLSTDARLNLPNLTPSKILTVGNGTRIGVIGFITPETMAISKTENLQILDEISSIKAEAKRLRSNGVKIIIALGHSGFDREVEIASQIEELSLVVGAHSHTLLYTPKDNPPSVEEAIESYPFMVTHDSGKMIPVVTAYAFTKYLGKLLVTFSDNGDVISAVGNPLLLDGTIEKDPQVESLMEEWINPLREEWKMIKGYTRVPLLTSNYVKGEYESNLGNLITDAMISYGVEKSFNRRIKEWTNSPIAIYNSGGIRCQFERARALTLEDAMMMLPFRNQIMEVEYLGWVIKAALENSVTSSNIRYLPNFLYVSGLRVVYNMKQPIGKRVESVQVLCNECSIPRYEPLKPNHIYTVLIGDYLLEGHNQYNMLASEKLNATKMGIDDMAILITYLQKTRVVYPILDGRITVKGLKTLSTSPAHINKATILPLFYFYLLSHLLLV